MAKTTVPAVASRDKVSEAVKLLESDYPAIFSVYRKIDKIRAKAGEATVVADYEIGSLIQEVSQDQEKYKEEGPERLMDALGVSDNQFYNWKKLAETWADQDEFRKLIDVRSSLNESITTQHLLILARCEKASDRKALHKRWKDESLSVHDLGQIKQAMEGGSKSPNPNGRKGNNPLSIIQSIQKTSQALLNATDSGEIAFNAIDKHPKKHASQTLLDKIEEALVSVRDVALRAGESERLLENAKDKVVKQLEAQEKEEAEKEAAANAKARDKAKVQGKKVKKGKKIKVRGTAGIETVTDDDKPAKKKGLKPLKLKKALKSDAPKKPLASPAKSEKLKKKTKSSALAASELD